MSKPLIGITLNIETKRESEGGYANYPWYAMRCDYARAVVEAGGIPVHIGHELGVLDDYLERLDGFVLTGADVPYPEQAYEYGLPSNFDPDHPRLEFEFKLIRRALANDIPTLGICAGMQNMNVALGGSMYKDVVQSLGSKTNHKDLERHVTKHEVEIDPGSQLFEALQEKTLQVNSNHREGIHKPVSIFTISSQSPDGVIEGIEVQGKKFFMGVQWHPEFKLSDAESRLWEAFIDAAVV